MKSFLLNTLIINPNSGEQSHLAVYIFLLAVALIVAAIAFFTMKKKK